MDMRMRSLTGEALETCVLGDALYGRVFTRMSWGERVVTKIPV